ncbi:glycerophosphodiester phosphodiesterase [Pleomorphovibrio marinus]|uniref:glycerophosphodiester phosphodiesterase n=1 Tax=Pleomorphovibrio marinus TaxID=2164132 RepID=UPI000E0A1CD2|nr:glycerophosphodiester phosphodiesterase family protein [Pleomorphovibrio marinus]
MNHLIPIIIVSLIICLTACGPAPETFLDNPVIAHRGAWKTEGLPQNSIASLQRAIDIGCAGSEFDVWMTSDGVLVLNHDADYEGLVLETATFEEVSQLRLSNGERLPTAEEYIRKGMTQNRTKLIFEVKPSKISTGRGVELAEKSVDIVKSMGAEKWVDYITFDHDIGLRIIALDPDANVAYLNGDKSPQELKEAGYFGLDYNIRVMKENPNWFEEARELGLNINVWTVNNREDMEWLLDQNVDYITTDEPELLFEMLND